MIATVHVGSRAGTPVVGAGYVWVPNTADGTVSKIDARTNRVVATLRIGDAVGLYHHRCAAWSVHSNPVGSFDVRRCDLPSALAFWGGSLWAVRNDTGDVVRIDPRTDRVVQTIPLTGEPFGIGVGPSGVWVTDFQNDTVSQYDPTTPRLDPASGLGLVRSFPRAGLGPSGVLVAPGAVWVALSREDSVIRIDPASGAVVAKVPTGSRPLAMVELAGSLWVRNEKSSSVTRIDETTNKVLATVPITYFQGRDGQDAMAVASGHIWTSGVVLDQIDPASSAVSRRVAHSSITLGSDGEALWTTDIDGAVSRIRT